MEAEKCPKCDKIVYEAEGYPAGGQKFHKRCLKCSSCTRKLDSNSVAIMDNKLFCIICMKKNRSQESPKIYPDTKAIAPSDEKGCPRCDGAVFEAEKLTVKEDSYHKRCFTCFRCSRALDSLIVMTSTDGNIYCKVCYKIAHAPDRPQVMTDLAVIPAEEEKDGCPRCTGKVFEAEKMTTKRGFYHKKCFACIKCKGCLNYSNAIEGPDDEVYCKTCYLRFHGPGGKNKYGEKTPFPTDEESPEACVRCKGKVFEAEKMNTKSGVIHKYCLSCNDCHTNLDASSFYNGNDGEVYCKYCYSLKFGHRQKSDYKGWMDVKAIPGEVHDKLTCPRCGGKVFEAERMVTRVGSYHKPCFSCIDCNKKLDSMTCCEGPDNEIYCKSCYSLEFGAKCRSKPRARALSRSVPKMFQQQDDILARSTVETWVIKAEKGDMDCCPKCDGKVFEAEKMVTASGLRYHKNCFRCLECNRLLDSLTNNDGADGGLYCKICYSRKYGPQTRSSDVDHKLIDTSTIKSEDDKRNCPKCGGAVFSAERVAIKELVFHKKCAVCTSCEKPLFTNNIYRENDDLFCDGCYRRKFAPCGYRGAGCASWVDSDSTNALRHLYQAF